MNKEIEEILAEMEAEETAPIEVITTDLIDPIEEEAAEEIEIPAEEMEDDVLVADRFDAERTYNIGDAVMLSADALSPLGAEIPKRFKQVKVYIRSIKNGNYGFSINKTGKTSGFLVSSKYITPYVEEALLAAKGFNPYLVLVKVEHLDIKSKPTSNSKTLKTIHRDGLYTIVDEKDDWGHMKIGGWIPLDCVRKII